ncbi:MAG: hypothetical protein OJF49_001436 [Ktedonobacterales bacterium]|jgi:hypothetical protein|nr:MAG: hypothetical protein OJF49_001436 [Ktedonobacterales bacterium]
MDCSAVIFSGHATQRMFERGLSTADILSVIQQGEVIEDYPNDTPHPSCLLLGFVGATPIHTVIAKHAATGRCIVVTVYVPNPTRWSADFKIRRAP